VGTWENHLSPCDIPGEGDRATKGPGVAWGLPPGCEPIWDTTNATEARKVSGSERRAKRPETGREVVLAEHSTCEGGEPRPKGPTGGKATPGITFLVDGKTGDTLRSPTVTTKRQQIAEQAAHDAHRVFPTLAHLIDADVLREASRQTSQSSAAGIDGVTAKPYAAHLDENRRDLHARLRRGGYQAPPGERVWREKDDGGQRPIGKPTFEDKMVQRAVAMLLEALYAQDFQDSS